MEEIDHTMRGMILHSGLNSRRVSISCPNATILNFETRFLGMGGNPQHGPFISTQLHRSR